MARDGISKCAALFLSLAAAANCRPSDDVYCCIEALLVRALGSLVVIVLPRTDVIAVLFRLRSNGCIIELLVGNVWFARWLTTVDTTRLLWKV